MRGSLPRLLKTRLSKSQPLDLMSKDAIVSMAPAQTNEWSSEAGNPTIKLTPVFAAEMAASFVPERATYTWKAHSRLRRKHLMTGGLPPSLQCHLNLHPALHRETLCYS